MKKICNSRILLRTNNFENLKFRRKRFLKQNTCIYTLRAHNSTKNNLNL